MRDYVELVKALRETDFDVNCEYCDRDPCVEDCYIVQAADAIEELLAAVPKWISVEERLPEVNNRVIACVNILGEQSVWDAVRWNGEEWEAEEEVVYEYWTSIDHPVTHWMPLPSAPKEV